MPFYYGTYLHGECLQLQMPACRRDTACPSFFFIFLLQQLFMCTRSKELNAYDRKKNFLTQPSRCRLKHPTFPKERQPSMHWSLNKLPAARKTKGSLSVPLESPAQPREEAAAPDARAVRALAAAAHLPAARVDHRGEIAGAAASDVPGVVAAFAQGLCVHLVGQRVGREAGVRVDVTGATAAGGGLGR